MFCDNCGNKLRDGAKFCPKCGSDIFVSADEIKERQRLTPDFSGIDKSKPIHERMKDIDKPVFKNEVDNKNEKPKKSKKKLIITISVILCCAIIGGIIVFFATRPISLENAYDNYIKNLKYENGKSNNGIDNVVIYDLNSSGIPDLVFTNDGVANYYYDEKTYTTKSEYGYNKCTYFLSEADNKIYELGCWIIDDSNYINYYIYDLTKDKRDYQKIEKDKIPDLNNLVIQKIRDNKKTIIFTNIPNDLNNLFLGKIDKTLPSMSYNQAIDYLEKRKTSNIK